MSPRSASRASANADLTSPLHCLAGGPSRTASSPRAPTPPERLLSELGALLAAGYLRLAASPGRNGLDSAAPESVHGASAVNGRETPSADPRPRKESA